MEKCRAIANSCSADAGPGARPMCDAIAHHCDQLADELQSDRADLEQCLQAAAACEQTATNPADCEQQRAACAPADRDFRERRGRTMECSGKARQCIDREGRFGRRGRADDADAGAAVCDDEATDFVGCCHGMHGGPPEGRGDAGVNGLNGGDRPGFGFGGGFMPRPHGIGPDRGRDDHDRGDEPDAGLPRWWPRL